jgi:hypothetical protein
VSGAGTSANAGRRSEAESGLPASAESRPSQDRPDSYLLPLDLVSQSSIKGTCGLYCMYCRSAASLLDAGMSHLDIPRRHRGLLNSYREQSAPSGYRLHP